MLFVNEKDQTIAITPTVDGRERWPWSGFSGWNADVAGQPARAAFDAKALIAGTMRLVTVTQSFGWIAGTEPAPLSFQVPPQFDSICDAGLGAMVVAPDLCKMAKVDPARFADRVGARSAFIMISHGGARTRADGLAALRVNEALGVHLVTKTLEWLHGICFPSGPADYGKIGAVLDDFAPFLRGVNAEVEAPQQRKDDRARRAEVRAEEQQKADAKVKVGEVKRKLHLGETVSNDDILAAAQAEVSKPPAKGRRQSGRR